MPYQKQSNQPQNPKTLVEMLADLQATRQQRLPTPSAPRQRIGHTADGRDFFLTPEDRKAHTHIIGGTRRGKSVFIEQQIRRDLDNPNCSLCLIDPHEGSVYDPLLNYIAYQRPDLANRVVLFDPAGASNQVIGYNPLHQARHTDPHHVLNMVVSACLKAWGQDSTDHTPRITRWLENIFALLIINQLTLLECAPLLSTRKHNEQRDRLLQSVQNCFIEEDWNDFVESTKTMRQQYLEGAQNRLRKFLRNPYLRRVFGQQNHVLSIDRIRDEKLILLVKLPEGNRIDRESNQLIGVLLIHEIFRSIMERNPLTDPHPFYLYIDEFGQFASRQVAYLMEEARKYGLFLTIAHQHLAQLKKDDEYLYASVLTNCHNHVVLGGLSYEDAQVMDQQIHTGYQNLLAIKDKIYQTKFRPVLEWQESHGISYGESSGHSQSWSVAFGQSASVGEALARSVSHGLTETNGLSIQETKGASAGISHGKTANRGTTQTNGTSYGETESTAETEGGSHTENNSYSSGHSSGFQQGENNQIGSSSGNTQQLGFDGQRSLSANANIQQGTSNSVSSANNESHSSGTAVSTQHSTTKNRGTQHGHSKSDGRSENTGSSQQQSQQLSIAYSLGRQHSQGTTETRGKTVTENTNRGLSRQQGQSGGIQQGLSRTHSINRQLGTRHEEFQEATPVYWTLPEIQHMGISRLMHQPIGHAVFQIGTQPPVEVKIDYRPPPAYHPQYTPRRLQELTNKVFQAHQVFYQSLSAAQQEIAIRQQRVFGGVLELDLTPVGQLFSAAPVNPPALQKPPAKTGAPNQPKLFTDDE